MDGSKAAATAVAGAGENGGIQLAGASGVCAAVVGFAGGARCGARTFACGVFIGLRCSMLSHTFACGLFIVARCSVLSRTFAWGLLIVLRAFEW